MGIALKPAAISNGTAIFIIPDFPPYQARFALKISCSLRCVSRVKPSPGATIAFMAKFKPAKAKKPTAPTPQGAIACVVMVILAIAGVMLLLFFVMKSSGS
jgi:hypothetical protein